MLVGGKFFFVLCLDGGARKYVSCKGDANGPLKFIDVGTTELKEGGSGSLGVDEDLGDFKLVRMLTLIGRYY